MLPPAARQQAGRYSNPPWLVWAICTVARSGSSWLSQLVSSTGTMGVPEEYLLAWPQQATRLGLSAATSFSDYVTFLLHHRSTSNGVFAIKGSVEELQPFFELFLGPGELLEGALIVVPRLVVRQ